MKKNIKTKKVYSEDHIAVILEDISSQFKVFGEVQSLLSDKADNLGVKVDAIDKRLENVEVKIDAMDERLKTMDERLIRVEDDVVEIKHKLSEKVDMADFIKLENRLIKLEKMVLAKV